MSAAGEAEGATTSSGRAGRLVLGAVCALWLALTIPLALGTSTFFARDVFTTHLHAKAFGARELAQGRVPYFRTDFGLGETFRGDPNYLPLYPGNVLYLVLPFWSAFNLHYALHWLLALFTMRRLARALGLGPEAALLAGMTYAGCGYALSCLGFYNLVTLLAWWPLAIAGAVAPSRRALALGALACGLALLGGEPISAALGLLPMVLLAAARLGAWRAVQRTAAIGGLGLLLALPQVVATARVIGFSGRGALGVETTRYVLHPARLLELVVPLPFGDPFELGASGFVSGPLAVSTPFVYSLHFGVVGLLLAIVGARGSARERWVAASAGLAAAGFLLAWLGGPLTDVFAIATFGLFRYPEKLLLWPALALPLLAGHGLTLMTRGSSQRWTTAALASFAVILALAAASPAFDAGLGAIGASDAQIEALRGANVTGAALSAVLLGLAALATRLPFEHRGVALMALQLLALLRLAPLWATDDARLYREPAPWSARVPPGASVVAGGFEDALGLPPTTYLSAETTRRLMTQAGHLDLDFPTGTLAGYRYPLVHTAAGLGSPLLRVLRQALPSLEWHQRIGWLRMLGVEYLTLPLPSDRAVASRLTAGLEPLEIATHAGSPTLLARIRDTGPEAWWPERVELQSSARGFVRAVADTGEPESVAYSPLVVEHVAGAQVSEVARTGDALRVEVRGSGGLLVLRRSFHPLLRATAGDRRLRTVPVNLLLLGVVVPPGEHVVRVEVPKLPDVLAIAGALGALAVLGAIALGRATPARDSSGLASS